MPYPMKRKYKKPDGTFRYYSDTGLHKSKSMPGLICMVLKHRVYCSMVSILRYARKRTPNVIGSIEQYIKKISGGVDAKE